MIAKSVETPAALAALRACGIDFAQGHAVGMPLLHLPGAATPPVLVAGTGRLAR
jgi:EAL domain-containing protein (putative c-di-GMP-specific phosphodiesterase class I)